MGEARLRSPTGCPGGTGLLCLVSDMQFDGGARANGGGTGWNKRLYGPVWLLSRRVVPGGQNQWRGNGIEFRERQQGGVSAQTGMLRARGQIGDEGSPGCVRSVHEHIRARGQFVDSWRLQGQWRARGQPG